MRLDERGSIPVEHMEFYFLYKVETGSRSRIRSLKSTSHFHSVRGKQSFENRQDSPVARAPSPLWLNSSCMA
jgi:hypothetical protein